MMRGGGAIFIKVNWHSAFHLRSIRHYRRHLKWTPDKVISYQGSNIDIRRISTVIDSFLKWPTHITDTEREFVTSTFFAKNDTQYKMQYALWKISNYCTNKEFVLDYTVKLRPVRTRITKLDFRGTMIHTTLVTDVLLHFNAYTNCIVTTL